MKTYTTTTETFTRDVQKLTGLTCDCCGNSIESGATRYKFQNSNAYMKFENQHGCVAMGEERELCYSCAREKFLPLLGVKP
jgi:hypothetical protein